MSIFLPFQKTVRDQDMRENQKGAHQGSCKAFLKLLISIGLIALVIVIAGRAEVFDAIREAALFPLILGLGLTIPQVVLSAARWRWISEDLGSPLSLKTAVAEYYVASFLNQTLPGGVAGEGARIYRRGQVLRRQDLKHQDLKQATLDKNLPNETGGAKEPAFGVYGEAAKPVVFERAFGQVIMLACAIPGLSLISPSIAWLAGAALSGACLFGIMIGDIKTSKTGRLGWIIRIAGEFKTALFRGRVFFTHLLASLFVTASYIAVFWLAALSLGVAIPLEIALLILPPALAIMALPITPAGWGLREGASAVLWSAAGLSLADGVAASILYGVVNLIAVTPGCLLLWHRRG